MVQTATKGLKVDRVSGWMFRSVVVAGAQIPFPVDWDSAGTTARSDPYQFSPRC